jgi:glutamyl-tRNA reductase
MPVVVVGLSHRTAPVEIRERLAFPETTIPEALQRLREQGLADEAVIVSTCNRVELYAVTRGAPDRAANALRQYLFDCHGVPGPLDAGIYAHEEPRSLEHLFKVVSGLDSMVLGETEILGQVKKAYDLALQCRATGRHLNRAFQRAFNVAKQIRTETNIQRGSVSVASVAVDLAEKIFDTLARCNVLVIGAGDTGEKAAKALLSRGAKGIVFTNRSFERAAALAAELGGRAVPFDDWSAEFANVDIIISSTAAPGYVLDRPRLEPWLPLRRGQPVLLVDIAVPRDIDPAVNTLDGVFLYDIDDLQAIADDALRQRKEDIARCEVIIRDRVQGLLSHPQARPGASDPRELATEAS